MRARGASLVNLTLEQARAALARAEARVHAERPGDLALALIIRKRYRRLVALLEGTA